jgi:PIN domain nuclease of toxin-antitoxin system
VIVLDSHVLHWWSAEPERLSSTAAGLIAEADELAVADVTWWELAWLAHHERILLGIPVRTWLERLAAHVRTLPVTPGIAELAARLPASFPGDPADRLIFATAIEHGCSLVTKDARLLRQRSPRPVAVW